MNHSGAIGCTVVNRNLQRLEEAQTSETQDCERNQQADQDSGGHRRA